MATQYDFGAAYDREALLRPILRGRDIRRYGYQWAELWLIATHNGVPPELAPVNIEEYPSVRRYLDTFGSKLTKRTDQGVTPYHLRSCAYWEEFSKPKVVWKAVGRQLAFALVGEEYLVTAPACFICGGDYNESILAYLCSDYGAYFIYRYSDTTGAGDIMLNVQSLMRLPIPKDVLENKALQDAIKRNDMEQVERYVFESFGFTEEEIAYMKEIVKDFSS